MEMFFPRTLPFIQILIQEQVLFPACFQIIFAGIIFPFPRSMIGIGKLPAGILFPQATGQTTYHFLTDRQQIITVYIKLPAVRIICIVE